MHRSRAYQSILIPFRLLFVGNCLWIDQTQKWWMKEARVEWRHSPVLLHSIKNNRRSSASSAVVVPLLPMTVCPLPGPLGRSSAHTLCGCGFNAACVPTQGQTLGLMLFLLKQKAAVTALCDFWHWCCLSGSLPPCFCVCIDARADLLMFPVGSQWF